MWLCLWSGAGPRQTCCVVGGKSQFHPASAGEGHTGLSPAVTPEQSAAVVMVDGGGVYIFLHTCVCVRERERERERLLDLQACLHSASWEKKV